MKKILNALICLIGILGITLGIVEVASRFYFAKEKHLAFTALKKSEDLLKIYVARTRATIPTNSDDEYILFFGDSFTFGDTLPLESSYPKVFERCLQRKGSKLKVLNLGIQGAGILDHGQAINRFLTNELSSLKVKRIILGLTQNDRYIEPWGFHPYDACPSLYPHSYTRPFHHDLFSVYYFDYLVNKKSHTDLKDPSTEACFKNSFNQIKSLVKQKNIPLTMTFLADAIKTDTHPTVIGMDYRPYAESFSKDFDLDLLVINKVLNELSSDREIYAVDNYHFNASTNAIIGEYLCEQIKL